MAGKTLVIGCKLPHGLVIEHPSDPSKTVVLAGLNKALVIGATHATTEVDDEFWQAWKAAHKDFPALRSGAIFEAKSTADAAAQAKELADEKTGFEPMPQNAMGVEVAVSE